MTFKPLELQDCQNIAKAFERGAAYCVTEESVFALMTPLLTGIRAQSASLFNQIEAGDKATNPKSVRQQTIESQGSTSNILGNTESPANMMNMDKADEDDDSFITKIKGNFFPGSAPAGAYPNTPEGEGIVAGLPANIAGGIFNSECIPCGDRLNMLGELNPTKFLDLGKDYLQNWLDWLTAQLKQLLDLLNMFTNTDNYVDLCALLKWLNDFICIPDLQRILSALMALMSRVSLEIGGIFDIIMALIGPLVAPFLSGFVDLLQSYILLIIRPIECIINNIQDIIRKLDYNILFQNIDSLDTHISIGSDAPVTGSVKIPFVGTEIKYGLPPTGKYETEFNMLGPAGDAIKKKNQEDQIALENAAAELQAIRQAGMNIDASDPVALERYNRQKTVAEDKYRKAVEQRSLSKLGRANQQISAGVDQMKSSLFTLIGFLREAVAAVEGFFQDIFDELKKIMGSYVGGGNGFVEILLKKLVLVQMIAFIAAVISAFANGIKCGEDEEDLKIEAFLPKDQGFSVWTDDNGDIHIEEDSRDFDEAIGAMVEAASQAESSLTSDGITDPDKVDDQRIKDKGQRLDSEDSRQKLKSLVEFTGDPILDVQIARVSEALVTRVNATFKCPLDMSVAQAEKVNRWIRELNSE